MIGRAIGRGWSPVRGPQKPLELSSCTVPQPAREVSLAALRPVRLRLASGPGEVAAWKEWVGRYHPLRYHQPVGVHLHHFVLDRDGRKLGWRLFDFAAPSAHAEHSAGNRGRRPAGVRAGPARPCHGAGGSVRELLPTGHRAAAGAASLGRSDLQGSPQG